VDILSSALVSVFLLICTAGLMTLHVRTWRKAQRQELEADGLDYRRRQFRRRVQTSALLGLLAVAIFVGPFITGPPVVVFAFWGVVLLVVCWVALLAVVDVIATKIHFDRLREKYLVEQAKLQAELRRLQATRGNGRAAGRPPGPK
jgi:Na+/H+ antiporter NhaD/arsenite permease-like protein